VGNAPDRKAERSPPTLDAWWRRALLGGQMAVHHHNLGHPDVKTPLHRGYEVYHRLSTALDLPWAGAYSGAAEEAGMADDANPTVALPSEGLLVLSGEARGQIIPIPAGQFVLGREAGLPGRLAGDPALSRRHARITRLDRGPMEIEDLGSTNGTRLNGKPVVGRQPISGGDVIELGSIKLRVLDVASPQFAKGSGATDPSIAQVIPMQNRTDDPTQLLERAQRLLAEQRLSEAEAAFRAILVDSQYRSEGHYGLGVTFLSQGDPARAAASFEQCLQANPQHANALYQLGFIAERRGLRDKAVGYYRRTLTVDPQHASAKARIAALQRNLERAPAESSVQRTTTPSPPLSPRVGIPSPQYGVYEYLQQDATPISRQTVALMDALAIEVRPPLLAYVGHFLHGVLRSTFIVLLSIASLGIFPVLALIIGYIKVSTTKFRVARGRLQIEKGVFSKRLTNVDLWRVRNIDLERTLLNRMTGDGTLIFLLTPEPTAEGRRHREKHPHMRDQIVEVTGLARGSRLEDTFQQLLNLTFLLRGNAVVKGIIQ
jgi:TolA-binding protein/membrane protein YdbS with pleckstrin-like domain